jgi:hypothetical protein
MSKKISEYFISELFSWEQSIDFYEEEMVVLGVQLDEIIQRNSIVDIAAKVEAHQILLNEVLDKFNKIEVEISIQKKILQPKDELIADVNLDQQIQESQNEIRNKVQSAEKEYIDIKQFCYEFLSQTLNK